jgi:hypothetical protein
MSLLRSVSCSSDQYSSASLNEFDVDDYSTPEGNIDTADDARDCLASADLPEESIEALRKLHRGRLKSRLRVKPNRKRNETTNTYTDTIPGRVDSDQQRTPERQYISRRDDNRQRPAAKPKSSLQKRVHTFMTFFAFHR